MQIKPVFAGDGVPDGVAGMSVQYHLGIANRARGEIDQASIVAARLRASEFRGGFRRNRMILCPVFTTGCVGAALCNQDGLCNRWALAAYLIELVSAFLIGNKGSRFCHFGAKLNIFGCKKRSARYGN